MSKKPLYDYPPPHAARNGRQTKINTWRIAEIDAILQSGKSYTARQLAEMVGKGGADFSPRTIQRDIEYMRDTLRAPIESGWQGYRYAEPNFFIKSIPLTEGEAFSVAVLNPLLEQYRNTPLEKQLRSVFAKIAACLPDRITVDTSFLNPKITFIPDNMEGIDPAAFTAIFSALKSRRTLAFEYRPLQKSTFMERKIDPYHVACQRGNWYVIGRCHEKGDVRIFSFARMRSLRMTGGTFRIPEGFKASDYIDPEAGVWVSDREPLDVELIADSEIGTFARGRAWHSGQEVEELADGSVRVRFRTTQRRELVRWVLGQGHTVRVLAPPELVAEIRAEIDRVRGMYEE